MPRILGGLGTFQGKGVNVTNQQGSPEVVLHTSRTEHLIIRWLINPQTVHGKDRQRKVTSIVDCSYQVRSTRLCKNEPADSYKLYSIKTPSQ